MVCSRRVPSTLALVLLVSIPAAAEPAAFDIAGHWEGTVPLDQQNLHIVLNVEGTAAQPRATISIPESRLDAFPLPHVGIEGTELSFDVPGGWGLAMFAGLGLAPEEEVISYRGQLAGS